MILTSYFFLFHLRRLIVLVNGFDSSCLQPKTLSTMIVPLRENPKSDVVITAPNCPFQGARTALTSFALGIGCCVLASRLAVASTAPWYNKVRPTEELVLATSADDPAYASDCLHFRPRSARMKRSESRTVPTPPDVNWPANGELSGCRASRIFSLISEPEREASVFNGQANS